MNIEECFRHIPNRLTPDMKIFAHDVVFHDKHYIFVERSGSGTRLECYCTYCRKYFDADKLRHKQMLTCPHCQAYCTVRSAWRGRKKLIDEAYFTYYLKSAIDPQAIVAIGTYVVRDFRGDYRTVETKFADMDLYVFQPGTAGVAFHRQTYYSMAQTMEPSSWYRARAAKCQFNRDRNHNIHCTYSRDSIIEAVAGTPYRYSTWEQYQIDDMVEFFDLCSRYQCIEYLTKLGFSHLVKDKLGWHKTYRAINWRGKTPLQVLGLTKQELHDIRKNDITMTFLDLKILQSGKKDDSNLTPAEAEAIATNWGHMLEEWQKLKQYGSLRKLHSYFTKQLSKNKIKRYDDCLRTWRDYLADCERLGMDLSRETVVFPRNLHRAHQNTIKQVKYREDELLDRRINLRFDVLNKLYRFEYNGLLIRPASSTKEIIAEGSTLSHCIGGYSRRYADGQTDLFFIRKTEESDKPYYSVEIRKGELIQCRGFKNCEATKEVKIFLEVFLESMFKQNRKEAAN